MKRTLTIILLMHALGAAAQLTPENAQKIKAMEDSIRIYGDTLINSQLQDNRTIASYRIIKTLTAALRVPNAYYYQWDSTLPWRVSYPEDGSFRIFTWHVLNDNGTYKYYGTIQMKADTLKMFPLIDYSDFTDNPMEVMVDNNNWIGALYYNIKTVKSGKTSYYTIFGWDGNSLASTKKVMEILWFKDGKPRFGAPIIQLAKGKTVRRFILEYSKEASATLNYSPLDKKVIYDHVAPNGDALEGFFANYIPDGTYEGFEWKKGKWKHLDNIEYEKRQDGDVPNAEKKKSLQLYTPKPAPTGK